MTELPFKIPESTQEMMALLHSSRAELAALWQRLNDAQMIQIPGPQADWSVKDLIAHIVWWESFTMQRITLLAAGEEHIKTKDYDAVNAQVFKAHKDLPLGYVLKQFEENLQTLEAILTSFPFETLTDETHFPSLGVDMLRIIGGNTFGHYYEHMDDLKQFVAK